MLRFYTSYFIVFFFVSVKVLAISFKLGSDLKYLFVFVSDDLFVLLVFGFEDNDLR